MEVHSNCVRAYKNRGRTAPTSAFTDVIDFMTIATLGNAIDFGDLISCQHIILQQQQTSTRASLRIGYDNANHTPK